METRNTNPALTTSNLSNPALAELTHALDHLLHRYIDLIDSAEHGGWTAADEASVRSAQTALYRAGFAHRQPVKY